MRIRRVCWVLSLAVLLSTRSASAQEVEVQFELQPGPTITVQPARKPPTSAKPAQPAKPGAKPGGAAKPGAKPGTKPGAKPSATPTTVQRPTEPESPANPEELKLRPDEEGKLQFNFTGQPWPDVLEWLAEVSRMSLDWQELPAGYLNLKTRRKYTVDEARSLINRHLLARGFTMLQSDEGLTVVNIKKIDLSMVPRVDPKDLANRDPYEFVKVSFKLDWLLAETVVVEMKPILSQNGKLIKFTATNRVEAVDAVINLRELDRLLREEQETGGKELVRVFKLHYTRADEVVALLESFLHISSKSSRPAGPMTPQQMAAMQQAAMRAQQQGKKPATSAKPTAAKISLLANRRENSILAHAPPDKMILIQQTIETLDVPSAKENSLLRNVTRWKIYRLAAIDPGPIVKILEEMGDLDPTTRIKIDTANNAIIAYATLVDHLTIKLLVDKLDGSSRSFAVIRLRRLDAEYVAGTIQFMMGGEEKQQQPNYSRFMGYNPYGSSSSSAKKEREFKVDADVENNKLLLWANPLELEEVENLLIKLGEIPARGGDSRTIRVIETMPGLETEQMLERIRAAWKHTKQNPNPLHIAPAPKSEPQKILRDEPAGNGLDRLKVPENKATIKKSANEKSADTSTGQQPKRQGARPLKNDRSRSFVRLAQLTDEAPKLVPEKAAADPPTAKQADETAPPESAREREFRERVQGIRPPAGFVPGNQSTGVLPPVNISRGPDGRLIISSTDTQALDLLEEMMAQFAPPKKEFYIIKLKHPSTTWAWGIVLTLEEFFENEEETKKTYEYDPWRGFMPSTSKSNGPRRLSRRKPLKFIPDSDTGTILVQGADARQMEIIQQLVDLYDVLPSSDSQIVRKTKIIPVHHSRAKVVADAIKEVYRDLLSSNDKALQNNNGKKDEKTKPTGTTYTYVYGGNSGDDKGENRDEPIKFKGLLSIGVDELSNTLIVSASENLLANITQIVEELDRAAMSSSSVQVMKLNPGMNAALIKKQLSSIFGKPSGQPNQGKQPGQQQPGQNPPQQQQNGAVQNVNVGG